MKIYRILPGAKGTLTVHRRNGNLHCSPFRSREFGHTLRELSWQCNGTIEDGKYYEFQFRHDAVKRILTVQAEFVQVLDDN